MAAASALSLPAIERAGRHGHLGVSLAILPFATAPLLWRRRHPGAVLVAIAGALGVAAAVGRSAPGNVGILFAVYAAALYGSERLRVLSGLAAGAASVAAFVLMVVTDRGRLSPHLTAAIAFGSGAAWVLGEAARTRRGERDEHASRAAEEERIRIARELHDIVTHHVSVIAVQAGAARSTSQTRPERALEALGVIEHTARSALGELRTLLGVLRTGQDRTAPAPLRPGPSITRLDELLAQARAGGITVDAEVRGTVVPLDAVVEVSAYRVVQEALTNVIKHAPAAKAEVLIDYRPHELLIAVVDDGPGQSHRPAAGHGIVGMRERVELAGGRLRIGPDVDGGFRVEARLPA